MKGEPMIDRFARKVEIEPGGCWTWTAGRNANGYGTFGPRPDLKVYAHRWAYETFVEPIPAGLVIDHLCRQPSCVNPDHLEAVTQTVNLQRSAKATKTHCVNGHEFTESNTYRRPDTGTRQCRSCASERYQAQRSTTEGVVLV